MLLHIVARGQIGRSPEAELVDRYLKRIAWPTKITELPDTGGKHAAARRRPPSPSCSTRTAQQLGSLAFAELLGRWRDDGVREGRFLIGAADGFDDAERASADLLHRLRRDDLAAPAGPRDAGRAIVARDQHPCQPSLSSRGLSDAGRHAAGTSRASKRPIRQRCCAEARHQPSPSPPT